MTWTDYWLNWHQDLPHLVMCVALTAGGFNVGWRLTAPRKPAVAKSQPDWDRVHQLAKDISSVQPGTVLATREALTDASQAEMARDWIELQDERQDAIKRMKAIDAQVSYLRSQGVISSGEAHDMFRMERQMLVEQVRRDNLDRAVGRLKDAQAALDGPIDRA